MQPNCGSQRRNDSNALGETSNGAARGAESWEESKEPLGIGRKIKQADVQEAQSQQAGLQGKGVEQDTSDSREHQDARCGEQGQRFTE